MCFQLFGDKRGCFSRYAENPCGPKKGLHIVYRTYVLGGFLPAEAAMKSKEYSNAP